MFSYKGMDNIFGLNGYVLPAALITMYKCF